MDGLDKLVRFLYRTRSNYRRRMRVIFPSPLEMEFIELMGGRVVRLTKIKQRRTGFPAAIVTSRGPLLKAENVRREVRYGKYYVDFANDLHRIIELDGAQWHMDVVADMDREIYIKTRQPEARFMRIKAYELRNNPRGVQQKTMGFLQS